MELKSESRLMLLDAAELQRRASRVAGEMRSAGLDAMLLCDNANLYYMTGRVFCGFILVGADESVACFLRRPSVLHGENAHLIRKPEEIPAIIETTGNVPARIGFEADSLPFAMAERLKAVFPGLTPAPQVMRKARAVKTEAEIAKLRRSGIAQTEVYATIPHLFREGMSDIELQIEIERALRLHGSLGQFRCAGPGMEIYMGNVLTGDNADTPSPYDFAMGGAGLDPSLPVGADGTIIHPGIPVMVDLNGNFTGYMTDMTRCFCVGTPRAEAVRLNDISRRICDAIARAAVPGAAAKDLYRIAADIAETEHVAEFFMGHRYHAGFVGHGVGIEINELPVLAPRSHDVLEAGMAFAVEPKFVVPGIGAAGIENTYVVRENGPAECLTLSREEIVSLN